jgi:hypothetical protein
VVWLSAAGCTPYQYVGVPNPPAGAMGAGRLAARLEGAASKSWRTGRFIPDGAMSGTFCACGFWLDRARAEHLGGGAKKGRQDFAEEARRPDPKRGEQRTFTAEGSYLSDKG